MDDRARVYMKTTDGAYRPLLWFKSHNANEIFWSPYGVKSKTRCLRWEFQEELLSPETLAEGRRPYFADAMPRNLKVDHFSSHRDGSFHLKALDQSVIYSQSLRGTKPLGPQMPPFLEFKINSDTASEYRVERSPLGQDAVVLSAGIGEGIGAFFSIAGREFPHQEYLSEVIRPEWHRGPSFRIGSFSAMVATYPTRPDAMLSEVRPRGTVVSIRFMLESQVWRVKTFIFE
jgi:hypothetical protein